MSPALNVLLLTAVLWLGACTPDGPEPATSEGPDGYSESPAPEPTWNPLSSGEPATEDPATISAAPTQAGVIEAAKGPPDRLSGEEFALAFANFYVDIRPDFQPQRILEDIGSDDLAPDVAQYLVEDRAAQRELKTQRQFDHTTSMWFRSQTEGGAEPTTVRAELAGQVLTPGLEHRTWFKVRVDVERRDERWWISDMSAAVGAPEQDESGGKISEESMARYLGSDDWRELPAAG